MPLKFWKKKTKEIGKVKASMHAHLNPIDEYNALILTREKQKSRLIEEADKLEKKRGREPLYYVR